MKNQAGFTLVELFVSTVLVAVAFTVAWGAFVEANEESDMTVHSIGLDVMLRATLDKVAEELTDSGTDLEGNEYVLSHPKDVAEMTKKNIQFRRRLGFSGDKTLDWSPPVEFLMLPSPGETPGNGTDDDGDGVVDENRLVRVQGGQERTVSDDIIDVQFTREANGDIVTVTVTGARGITRSGRTKRIERSLSRTIVLANRN